MADAYKKNMTNFIEQLRSDLNTPNIPFVMGKIAPRKYDIIKGTFNHQYRNQIRQMQDELGKEKNVATIETIDLPQSDNLHFNTAGLIELGKRFANKIINN
jgi:lysophospholipase L1-like esterase